MKNIVQFTLAVHDEDVPTESQYAFRQFKETAIEQN